MITIDWSLVNYLEMQVLLNEYDGHIDGDRKCLVIN